MADRKTGSILQKDERCFLCGRAVNLERHHIMAGTANRKLSEKYGLWVWLCHDCHTGKQGAQYDRELNQRLKRLAQTAFEAKHNHDEWMAAFRKNYL